MPASRMGGPPWLGTVLVPLLVSAAVYVALGAVSLATAYVQTNTATVWIPSGYAVGLIMVSGARRWPAVALGSFVLNLLVNLAARGTSSWAASVAVAGAIALGNTGEAIVGAAIAQRFASGLAFLARPRSFAIFVLAVVPLAPLISMLVGVAASHLGGVAASGTLQEIMLTWYIANAVGILIFTGPAILLLTRTRLFVPPGGVGGVVEALILVGCLAFASQAICGVYLSLSLADWPKAYMVIPFLFWASYRFGSYGALSSILLVTLISVVGTMRGFEVFPAPSAARSLLYLQIFLAMLTIMTLSISASLAENWDLQANLEARVRARTQDVERYLREKEIFTSLVAHDLQSPLFGVRNAVRAAATAIRSGTASADDLLPALSVVDETCVTLAQRVTALLMPGAVTAAETGPPVALSVILRRIASAHRLSMTGKAATLLVRGDTSLLLRAPDQIEHMLDILIDNAIRFSPVGSPIEIDAQAHGADLEIAVTDRGDGIEPDRVGTLFRPQVAANRAGEAQGAGLGLYLASEQARGLGGRLAFEPAHPSGSCFRLTLPV